MGEFGGGIDEFALERTREYRRGSELHSRPPSTPAAIIVMPCLPNLMSRLALSLAAVLTASCGTRGIQYIDYCQGGYLSRQP